MLRELDQRTRALANSLEATRSQTERMVHDVNGNKHLLADINDNVATILNRINLR